ncbi:hypothetical protein D0T53_10325 [Dysgonomonas sp. 216]|uniref:choice-of-anchor Q domain-containing protein n=1 Tax=Dysgonomonas sp. 216 TaxID=2302934 RepID=UPI0013D5CCF4|nr:choice-of-anchor Q domain-containing protein [Dysgonomonas sp. 216]NDW19306.1 hypothetical protein [Dysgonomonas sp. 216]
MKIYKYILLLSVTLSAFISCINEDEDFSSDPNLKIEFVADTISFDTIFTTFGSATKRIKVYNRNSNSLTFSTIELMGAGESGFRIKVPPYSGDKVHNVELLKKDSMYILIEVTVDPQNSDSPLLIRDSIKFEYNGNIKYMQLEAFGQDAFIMRGNIIEQDTIFTSKKPIIVFDSLVINKNATAYFERNTRLFFHENAGVKVYGSINVHGTLEQPVTFRGDRTDWLFSTVPYDRIPGQWRGIEVDSLSFNNHFEYFHLRNSVNGIVFKRSNLSEQKAIFINSIIHNTSSDGIYAQNCKIEGYNSLFSNSGATVMKLIGGDYYFLHCTLANYMEWRRLGSSRGPALTVGNINDNKEAAPLIRCEFVNSIISGKGFGRHFKEQKSPNTSIIFNRLTSNCLIKVNGEDDAIDVNTVWNVDPEFKDVDKNNNYYYNFEPDSISPAINKGDRYKIETWTTDMLGVSRISDEGPDIGCYEWTPTVP